ncbi:MAG TPA: hypothetical protein VE527_13510, partial [Reyranella sp.]|nr:hypothetical protein [Reyranella sp.]
ASVSASTREIGPQAWYFFSAGFAQELAGLARHGATCRSSVLVPRYEWNRGVDAMAADAYLAALDDRLSCLSTG